MRQQDEMRRDYIPQKGYQINDKWEREWWCRLYKSDESLKSHLFPYRRPSSEEGLIQEIMHGDSLVMFNVVLKCLNNCATTFLTFLPFSNILLWVGMTMLIWKKQYSEKENIIVQPRRKLISSFLLTIDTIKNPLLSLYLKLALVCKKFRWFVQYAPWKGFENLVQSAVDARRQGDKSPNSSFVAATMELLADSSFGYQIMDRCWHTVTKYLPDEKTNSANISKMFKRIYHINDQLYEVELLKSEIELRESIIVGFFILQYVKLRISEPYYNFFKKFCDTGKCEELEMDSDSVQ